MLEVDIRCTLGGFTLQTAFSVPSDALLALFGPSGAGKTTLLHALAGVITPTEGTIRLDQQVFFSSSEGINRPIEARGIGYVFQEGRLFPHLSVADNLDYGRRHHRAPSKRPVVARAELIELLALGPLLTRRTPDLSGGERQRVALARALLAQPSLVLLDEPLAALDGPRKQEVMGYIERLRALTRVPMVLVSHAVDEVVRLSDQLAILEQGRLRAVGDTKDVLTAPELAPLFGEQELSSLIIGSVIQAGSERTLSSVAFAGGMLKLPTPGRAVGDPVRLRVRASDVAVALSKPVDTSVTNLLDARIVRMDGTAGPSLHVLLDVGGTALLASITHESAQRLGLVAGLPVIAMIKSIALLEPSLGP